MIIYCPECTRKIESSGGICFHCTNRKAISGPSGVDDLPNTTIASPPDVVTIPRERYERLLDADRAIRLVEDCMAWQRETFKKATPSSCANHLLEEARELVAEPDNAEEAADCLMLTFGWFNMAVVDWRVPFAEKLAKNKARKWGEPNEHGYAKHIDAARAREKEAGHG